MPKITFIAHDGTEHTADADVGLSLMETAVNSMIPGIDADCGGACACATCHVYIDPAWRDSLPRPDQMELSMLEFAYDPKENSRLSCQISVTAELDGLVVRLPSQQG